jgi:hypothetical protein
MKRRDLVLYSLGAPFVGGLQGCGGGGGGGASSGPATSFKYLSQSDFAKSMKDLLYAGGGSPGAPSIDAFDPYWVDVLQNKSATGVVYGFGTDGYDGLNKLIAYKLLKSGPPLIDLAGVTGMKSPNSENYRACTAGVARATGVQLDDSGRVGMFINGFDTPSLDDGTGVFQSYGPDIHISRSYISSPIYLGPTSSQCLRMTCKLSLGETYFAPAAGTAPGVGGQIVWRVSFQRFDGKPFATNISEIVVLIGLWESRSVGDPGFDGNDTFGNVTDGEYWVSGTLAQGKNSKFVENTGDSLMTGPSGWRSSNFSCKINRLNMLNILSAFGADSTTPEMVRLSGTTYSGEIYDSRTPVAQFKPGQFGFVFEGQTVDVG